MSLYKNLLLVDDDADDQEIFLEAMKEIDSSANCTCYFDGETALKTLHLQNEILPDLIILDTNIPKISGKQVLIALKSSPTLSAIPVVMYSTSFFDKDIAEFARIGAVHHLQKPSKFDDFRNELSDILKTKW